MSLFHNDDITLTNQQLLFLTSDVVLLPPSACTVCVHSNKAGYDFPSSSSWGVSQGQDHTGLHYDGHNLIMHLFSSTGKEPVDNTSTAGEGTGYLV